MRARLGQLRPAPWRALAGRSTERDSRDLVQAEEPTLTRDDPTPYVEPAFGLPMPESSQGDDPAAPGDAWQPASWSSGAMANRVPARSWVAR
ncbi:MAG: hypothetical protein ACXWW6_04070, partial [Candidatus Limnocylindrales bacterium]